MARRLIIVGTGRAAERLADLGGWLEYDEIKASADVPDDLEAGDHLVVAEDEPGSGRDALLAVARGKVMPAYVGYASTHREGWKALVGLAATDVPKSRLDAIAAPAGSDLGAETPEEIAIAVAADLVALRRNRPLPSEGLPIAARGEPNPKAQAKSPVPTPRRVIGGFARKRDGGGSDDSSGGGRN